MKQSIRLLSLLLSIAMVFSMLACDNSEPTTTTETTVTTEPVETTEATIASEPSAADIYNAAKAKLDSATDISLSVDSTSVTTVNGSVYSEHSTMTVTYRDIGKETAAIFSEETLYFSEEDEDPIVYTELWSQGQLYAQLDEKYRVVAPMDAEELKTNFVPAVLMDASLYESITSQETEQGTLITFSQATAPEAWLIPEEIDTTDITGTALIKDSVLTEMTYGITVDYGVSQIRLDMTTKPAQTPKEITVPDSTEGYISVDNTAVLSTYGTITQRLAMSDKLEMTKSEEFVLSAVAQYMTYSNSFATYGKDKDGLFHLKQDIYAMDYYNDEEYNVSYVQNYKDGKLTTTQDEGLPVSSSATWEEVTESMWEGFGEMVETLSPDYWENVTTTFFGNLILFEFDLNENFGNTRQNEICKMFFQDANFLMNHASAYENTEISGYLSIDGCTGLPVAIGFSYEGNHTIEGEKCPLTQEVSYSIVSPSVNAYKAITDEMPASQEPAEKATPLFYKVTGSNGQQMYLLGTIHVGDVRNEYLPQEIKDAFAASDALAVECDTDAFFEKVETDEALAAKVSELYYNEGEKSLEDILEEEDYKTLVQLLKATGHYDTNILYMKPSNVASSLSSIFMDLGYTFSSDYGVEEQLHKWAEEQNKPVREVESVLFQMEMHSHYSQELQIFLLQQAFEDCPGVTWMGVNEMYDLWCAGDEAALREFLAEEVDTSELTEEELAEYEAAKPLLEEYDKAMVTDRNQGMLEVAIEYLESGDVVFYAVGLAHLLDGGNGLVDTLREAGYTVELVTYAQ